MVPVFPGCQLWTKEELGKSGGTTGKHPPPSVYHTFVRTITRELTCFCSFHDILTEKTQTVRPLFFRWGGEGLRGWEEYNLSRSPRGPPLFPLPLPPCSLKSPILLHPRAQAAPRPRRSPCIHTHTRQGGRTYIDTEQTQKASNPLGYNRYSLTPP